MKKHILIALGLAVVFAAGMFSGSAHAGTSQLSGWAWSSNIGWISFNSSDTGAGGGPYAVSISTTTSSSAGSFFGYAWAPNIGWLSFNAADIADCPSASAMAVDLSTGSVTGWVRAMSGAGRTDGWDGCIELSGPKHETGRSYGGTRGVTYHEEDGKGIFKGYAWGGPVVGWVNFGTNIAVPVTVCKGSCGGTDDALGLTLEVCTNGGLSCGSTANVTTNQIAQVQWKPKNATSCAADSGDWSKGLGTRSVNGGTEAQSYGSAGTRVLTMTCTKGFESTKKTVTINVASAPVSTITCIQPVHSLKCDVNQSATAPYGGGNSATDLRADQASCTLPVDPPYCQFYCEPGYNIRGNVCVNSSATEF